MDVSGHVDAAVDAASEAVRGVIEQLPGQRRRRRRLPFAGGRALRRRPRGGRRGGLAAARDARSASTASDLKLDAEAFDTHALDRAADEGMSIEPDKEDALSHSNGEVRELSAIGDLV